jgi:cold shock CspA family protein
MQLGVITKLFPETEHGEITRQGGEPAHFHKQCLWNVRFQELSEHQAVEFEVQPSSRGTLAFHIRPVFVGPDMSLEADGGRYG